ncbi:radical SAM protein [bacterium]|nr:radical SAM protein [candidate division CSSED10-310 bacterium]
MDARMERLEQWRHGGVAGPVRIEAELTDRCNLPCVFCWRYNQEFARALKARRDRGEDELPADDWLRLVVESAALGALEWHICGGGEPLVRGGLARKLFTAVKDAGMEGLLTTNGTLIDDETAGILVDSGWDMVEISIESPGPKPNDELRGAGSHAAAMNAMARLNAWKRRLGSRTPRLQLAAVLCNRNHLLLPDLLRFTHAVGAEKLSVNPIVTPPGAPDAARRLRLSTLQLTELTTAIQEAIAIAGELGLDTNVADFLSTQYVSKTDHFDQLFTTGDREPSVDPFRHAHCFVPWNTIAIRPDGRAGPCVAYRYGEGEDVRRRNLADIWTGEYFQSVRRQILARRPPEYCSRCCAPFIIDGETTRRALAGGGES